MIYIYCTLDRGTMLGSPYDLLLLRGLEVLNQVIPIYLVTLKVVLTFLFAPLFVLT